MKTPRTIDGKINAIEQEINCLNYTIRKLWYCNAGWGLMYIHSNSVHSCVHAYYSSIKSCVTAEYNRVVLKKKERGGFYLNHAKNL